MNRPRQLDLFGTTPAEAGNPTGSTPVKPASPPAAPKAPSAAPSALSDGSPAAHPSSDGTGTPLPTPPANMPPSTRWRVVQAGNRAIGFVLRRSRRRTVG